MIETSIGDTQAAEAPSPGPALIAGVALILCACWMLVWRGALEGRFHFDDYHSIIENESIRELSPLSRHMRGTRPVGMYSFALNYHFAELNPAAYLLTNLFIHLANGFFIFAGCLLSSQLYRERWGNEIRPHIGYPAILLAALIATVWVVHPITTQAVTYIVQRFESLCSLGYLGAWVSVLIYLRGHKLLGCIFACVSAWLGFLSKEVFVSAPLTILLFDILVTRDSLKTVAKQRAIVYLLMLTPLVWTFPKIMSLLFPPTSDAMSNSGTVKVAAGFALETVTPWQYLRTQPEVIWHYLRLTVWPKQLCIDYVWLIQQDPLVYLPLGASILGLIGLGAFCYWRGAIMRRSFSVGLAGWLLLAFFFILAPTSSFVPIGDIAFEHRMYLASAVVLAGVCLTGHFVAGYLLHNSQRPAVLKLAFSLIAAALIVLLSWRTHLRNLDYCDGLILWQTAAEVSPKNSRAWYNVGRELVARGEWDAALQPMAKAVGYSHTKVPMYDIGLAHCLSHAGRTDDAVKLFLRALDKAPDDAEALNDLGVLYMQQSRTEEALESLEASTDLGYAVASHNLGMLQKRIGNVEAALSSFQNALELQPTFASATRRQAWILATTPKDALRDGSRAVALLEGDYEIAESESAFGWDAYAAALAEVGRFEEAVAGAERALELARESDQQTLAAAIQMRLSGYRERRRHRDDGSDQEGVPNQGDGE